MKGGIVLNLVFMARSAWNTFRNTSFFVFVNDIYEVIDNSVEKILMALVYAALLLSLCNAFVYLFYPSYIDHVEPTIATLGMIFRSGDPIYPELSEYSLHGLLYGPALAEIQAIFQSLGFPVIFASKVPGVLAWYASVLILFVVLRDTIARAYLVFILKFGAFVFWNRAEPFLLLLVAVSLLSLTRIANPSLSLFLVAVCAGFASSCKLHGFLYIIAACIVAGSFLTLEKKTFFLFIIVSAISFVLPYLPEQVSAAHFLIYIQLAAKHGLSQKMLSENFIFLARIISPIIYIAIFKYRLNFKKYSKIATIIFLEIIVAIIGAKPGAGTHHFIPIIAVNAYLMQYMLIGEKKSFFNYKIVMVLFSIFIVFPYFMKTVKTSKYMYKKYKEQSSIESEIIAFSDKYQGLFMGVSGSKSYSYVFFRPYLESKGTRQFDYAAFMDLDYSAVPDTPFYEAINSCTFSFIAMPKYGEPFSLHNYYTGQPLFSENVKAAFREHYAMVESGDYYSIFKCRKQP